jgi:mRNA interferase MazF
MNVKRGEVVLIDYPFSTGAGSKVRPALIVQSDARNRLLDHTIAVMISSVIGHAATDPTQLLIDVSTPEGMQSGLRKTSVVKCGNLYTIHESLIRKRIGSIPATMMQHMDDCLKIALEVS